MQNWHWFLIGGVVGYVAARRIASTGASFGFNLSGGFGASVAGEQLSDGAGTQPFGEPRGSEPYQTLGGWDPNIPGSFPDYVDPGAELRIVDGGSVD